MRRRVDRFTWTLLVLAVAFALVVEIWNWADESLRRAPAPSESLNALIAWNNEMIRAHGRGELEKAASLARKILANPAWRSFIPAQAVMGSVMAAKGDYAAAESFFRAALSGTGAAAPQPVVMNDYADTLCKLGRYAEAEAYARRAIAASGGRVNLYKMTLAQILHERKKS